MATNGLDPGGFYPRTSFPVSTPAGASPTDPYSKTNPTPIAAPVQPGMPMGINTDGLTPGLMPPGGQFSGAPYLAEGGAIPGEGDQGFSIGSIMSYGREKYGLGGRGFVPNGSPDYDSGQQQPAMDISQGPKDSDADLDAAQTKNFAEGGTVDDDEDDTTGAIPAEGGDTATPLTNQAIDAAAQSPQVMQSGNPILSAEHGVDLDEAASQAGGAMRGSMQQALAAGPSVRKAINPMTVPENARRIMQYLMGSDAAHPQQVQALENGVDPHGQMDPNDRKVAAIQAAQQTGGDDAAWAATQHYRQKFDHSKAFALAALSRGALQPGLNAINMGFQNLPDSQRVIFAAAPGGQVTATVTGQDGQHQQIPLSMQQLTGFLKGQGSMFDSLVDQGSAAALASIAQSKTAAPAQGQPTFDENNPTTQQAGAHLRIQNVRPGDDVAPGRPVSDAAEAQANGVDEQVVRQARAQFSDPRKRAAYYAAQSQQDKKNVIDMTKARTPGIVQNMRNEGNQHVAETRAGATRDAATIGATSREKVADTGAASREKVAMTRVAGWEKALETKGANALAVELVKRRSIEGNEAKRNVLNVARSMIMAGKKMTDVDAYFKQHGTSVDEALGTPPTVSAPTSVPSQSAPAAAAAGGQRKFYNGHWYTRGANGEAVLAE